MRISDWSSDVCSSDLLGDPFLPRRREEDQREAARLIVEAANLLESDQLEETGGGVGVGDPDHGVKIFGHAPNIVPRRRNGTGALPLQRRLSIANRSEEHTSELQSLMRISYAVFCLKKKKKQKNIKVSQHSST